MAIYPREDPRTTLPQLEKQITGLDGQVTSLDKKVSDSVQTFEDSLEPVEIDVNITVLTGSMEVMGAFKSGQTVQLVVKGSNSSAVDGGSNIATGTLVNYKPVSNALGCGYYSNRSIICNITDTYSIIMRNASSTQLAANSEAWCSITYITKEK